MTGENDARVVPPLRASWTEARAAGRLRLWFRGYRGERRDRLLAGRVGELLARESVGWAGCEQAAGRVPGALR